MFPEDSDFILKDKSKKPLAILLNSEDNEEVKQDGTHYLLEHITKNKEGRIIAESWKDVNNS